MHDVGNAADKAEFLEHMAFVIRENLRITMPGRCCAVHIKDMPLFQNRDGVMGIDPFSDDITAAYRKEGWVLQSRITVEKDPVIEMQKTNSHGLLFKNWRERAEILRTGLPDYVLIFVKPGVCPEPITHNPEDITYFGGTPIEAYRYPTLPSRKTGQNNLALPIWQEYANPVWSDVAVPLDWTDIDREDLMKYLYFMEQRAKGNPVVWKDINQMNVLNYMVAKTDKDERHICPLQLDLIGRLIHWKSNPGDVIFDPFGGIASTGYKALELGRRFVGAELKPEYHALGSRYLREAELKTSQTTLFDWAAQQADVPKTTTLEKLVNPPKNTVSCICGWSHKGVDAGAAVAALAEHRQGCAVAEGVMA
jgi:DNA modification methylase